MLTDVRSIRHDTLQNRAVIDFLLLTHGHSCEESEGLCCMNLSNHSESIHKSIQKLKYLTDQIKEDDGLWLHDLFKGWSSAPWLRELHKIGLYVLVILVVALVVAPCILWCVQQIMDRTTKEAFIVQDVGNEVKENSQNLTERS